MAIILFFTQYKMSLKLVEIKLNQKEFHRSKQATYLNQAEISKIVISMNLSLMMVLKISLGTKW